MTGSAKRHPGGTLPFPLGIVFLSSCSILHLGPTGKKEERRKEKEEEGKKERKSIEKEREVKQFKCEVEYRSSSNS